ncbi:putative RNA-directed DNA polymerase [Helianthus debilis subsp. tardiflorus]
MAEEHAGFQPPSVPKFDGDYDHWSMVMKTLLRSKEYWVVIEPGFSEPREGEQVTPTQRTNLETLRLKDLKAKNYLFQSIDKQILKTMTKKDTAKEIWDAMKNKYQGNARVKRAQLQRLRRDFETLEIREGEGITEYFGRVMVVANDMRNFGEDMTEVKVVEKILRSLTENFNFVVCSIEESKNNDELSVDELQSSLLVHEQKLSRKLPDDQVLKTELESSGGGRGRGRGRGSQSRGRGRGRGRSRPDFDKSLVECYRCHQLGHFSYECNRGDKPVNYAEFDEGEDLLMMTHAETNEEQRSGIWFLDSACSNHMTGTREWFINLDENFVHTVKLGNDLRLSVKGIGDVKLVVDGLSQIITKVYYVPDLTSSLISLGQLQERDVTVLIKRGECKLYHPQRGLIITSKMIKNRMFLVRATLKSGKKCLKAEKEIPEQLWHKRLGHVNNKSLRTMQFNQMVEGLLYEAESSKACEVCNLGKQTRENIPKKSLWRASKRLELLHTDLCGPINPTSPSGKRYVMVIVDDFSRKGLGLFS